MSILVRNPIGPGPDRVDRLRRPDRAGPEGRRDRVGPARLGDGRAGPGSQGVRHAEAAQGGARDDRDQDPDSADFPEGPCELVFCDAINSVRRQFRNDPAHARPARPGGAHCGRSGVQTDPKRTAVYLHIPVAGARFAIKGQALPNLPGSVRAAFASKRETPMPPIRSDIVERAAGRLGRGGQSDAAVHRGQGCRFVVIVVSLRR